MNRDPGSATRPLCHRLSGTRLALQLNPFLFLISLLVGFAYMQWRELRNPGALRKGALLLIRNGGTSEGELECDEPVTPL
jgi:hypothetical protein